jgi:hypothetical protein
MHRILPAGYLANLKAGYSVRAGYRISGRIHGSTAIFLGKILNKLKKQLKIIGLCKHEAKHDLKLN